METHVTLPKWLDDYIFNELGAKYCRSNSDMTVIDWDKSDMLNYLGTYFPRSYAEAYCIMSFYLQSKSLLEQSDISIFDFACGTGGEAIGFLTALLEHRPNLKHIHLHAIDGNINALRLFEKIISRFKKEHNADIEVGTGLIIINEIEDLMILSDIINNQYDAVISFKALCEITNQEKFGQINPYCSFINTIEDNIKCGGLLIIDDITTWSEVQNGWIPNLMNIGINNSKAKEKYFNEGFNQPFYITHSHKKMDTSKVAWRIMIY